MFQWADSCDPKDQNWYGAVRTILLCSVNCNQNEVLYACEKDWTVYSVLMPIRQIEAYTNKVST